MKFDDFITGLREQKLRHHAYLLHVSANMVQSENLTHLRHKLITDICGVPEQHGDILVVSPEKSLLRLEDIEDISTLSCYQPQQAPWRLILLERCEGLNMNATNALLKTVEEPQASRVLFLFVTAFPSRLSSTLRSRLQRVRLDCSAFETTAPPQIEPEDATWFMKFFAKAHTYKSKSLGIFETQGLLDRCQKLSKKYSAEILQGQLIIHLALCVKEHQDCLIPARFILKDIRNWQSKETFHLNTELYLFRVLSRFFQQGYAS